MLCQRSLPPGLHLHPGSAAGNLVCSLAGGDSAVEEGAMAALHPLHPALRPDNAENGRSKMVSLADLHANGAQSPRAQDEYQVCSCRDCRGMGW